MSSDIWPLYKSPRTKHERPASSLGTHAMSREDWTMTRESCRNRASDNELVHWTARYGIVSVRPCGAWWKWLDLIVIRCKFSINYVSIPLSDEISAPAKRLACGARR
jgi:hypothetical protein